MQGEAGISDNAAGLARGASSAGEQLLPFVLLLLVLTVLLLLPLIGVPQHSPALAGRLYRSLLWHCTAPAASASWARCCHQRRRRAKVSWQALSGQRMHGSGQARLKQGPTWVSGACRTLPWHPGLVAAGRRLLLCFALEGQQQRRECVHQL